MGFENFASFESSKGKFKLIILHAKIKLTGSCIDGRKTMFSLGHMCVLHSDVSAPGNAQDSPPLARAGLSQALVLVMVPVSHSTVQSPQGVQAPHTPFTENGK